MDAKSLSAHKGLMADLPHHNILTVFLGKEKEVAPLGVVEGKYEKTVRFEAVWDYFESNSYPET
jgi:hypothetical protein